MSNQLILVPLESLTERYTEQWARHLPVEFANSGYRVQVVEGIPLLDNEIKVGTFLDITSTCHYKAVQLQRISNMFSTGQVEQGASFFFSDIEFWGVEQVRLLARMHGINIKMYGFLHAASYTKDDAFAVAADFQRFTEVGWIAAFDKVFVGSEYHKRAVVNRRLKPLNAVTLADRIVVTKNPMFISEYPKFKLKRKKRMLLTNRFDREKNVHHTMSLFEILHARNSDWEFIVTTGRKEFRSNDLKLVERARRLERMDVLTIKAGLTKEQYHRELAQAAIVVTHSREENYGLCVAESILYGCAPLMWKGASHPEFVAHLGKKDAQDFLFTNLSFDSNGHIQKAERLMRLFEIGGLPEIGLDTSGMNNIIQHMKDL